MAGFTSVTNDQSIMFSDNVSFDGTERGGKVSQDGQLLIGSSVSPYIKPALLTSSKGSISYTTGHNSIDMDVTTAISNKLIILTDDFFDSGNYIALVPVSLGH